MQEGSLGHLCVRTVAIILLWTLLHFVFQKLFFERPPPPPPPIVIPPPDHEL